MGLKDRRARQKQALRGQILDAARDILVTQGFGGLSMRKVADRIEYSPTAIYLHFHDKQSLVAELGISRAQIAGVGDGANDLKFLAECGVSVAWRAKPVVRDQTTYALNHSGLDALLCLLSAETA